MNAGRTAFARIAARHGLAALTAALGAVLFVFYFPFLVGQHSFYQSDLTYYFKPFTSFICNAFRQGRLPLWNPYLYCGMSQIAVPSPGPFYPPVALFLLLPFSQALALYLMLHQLVAGVGAYLLVVSLGWGLFAAVMAAIAVACCGYLFALQANYTLVSTIVWLPLLLYALRLIGAPTPTGTAGVSPAPPGTAGVSPAPTGTAGVSPAPTGTAGVSPAPPPGACNNDRMIACETESTVGSALVPLGQPAFARTTIIHTFFAACVMALMVGAGRPELSVPAALIAGVYVLGSAFSAWHQDRMFRPVVLQMVLRLAAMLAGVLIAMPVLLPALEWAKLSPRAHGLELKWVLLWSANWYDVLMMFCAQPLGDLTRLGTPYLNMVAGRLNSIPYVTSTYIGPVVTTFAIWGLFDRRWRWGWVVLAAAVGFLLMAVGSHTPLAPAVCSLSPVFAAFRYPVKLMIVPMMLIIAIAARGAMLAGNGNVGVWAQRCSVALWLLLCAFGAVFLFAPGLSSWWLSFQHVPASQLNLFNMQKAQALFGRSFLATGGIGLLVGANYLMLKRNMLTPLVFKILTLAILAVVLLYPSFLYNRHGTVGNFYERRGWLASQLNSQLYAQKRTIEQRAVTLYFDPLTPGANFLNEQHLGFQDGFYLYARQLLLPNNNVDYSVPYSFGYEAAEVGEYKTLFSAALGLSSQSRDRAAAQDVNVPKTFTPAPRSLNVGAAHAPRSTVAPANTTVAAPSSFDDVPMARFCQMTGTRVVLTQAYRHQPDNHVTPLDARYFEPILDDPSFNVREYRPRTFLPRAFFANRLRQTSFDKFSKLFLDIHSPRLLDACYLEEPIPAPLSSSGTAGVSPAPITWLLDSPELVRLSATTSIPRLLVLCDQHYPGWNATLDSHPLHLYRVNFFGRGVVVPPGTHTVEFRYRPVSLYLGFGCTAAVILLFLLSLFLTSRKACSSTRSRTISDS